ncbi:MAG: hypothetical protein QOH90_2011 [Actinomycetota bacterium]|jgi:flavin reductase (DIM6/NTAB) family NADH-FMN oxidoreductase RutF|nr:hypothetical protein [Actinomycetota bacterium]
MPEGRAEIHDEDPFATPAEKRSPDRRFRGRLAAPVTIWTSGGSEGRTGLTVSSLLLAEGAPARILGLLNDTTDIWDAIQGSGTFVVHILSVGDERLAERFAGSWPSPGGIFAGLDVEDSEHGPVLADQPDRAYCRFTGSSPEGWHQLVRGEIERLEFAASPRPPLIHHRGAYPRLLEERSD